MGNESNTQRKSKCQNCEQLKNLKAENKELREEQDLMFLLLDITLNAVKKWGKEHGLFDTEKQIDENLNSQISVISSQSSDSIKEDFLDIFKALGS